MPTQLYEIKRNEESAITIWLLHLRFDAFFELPARDFYFATTSYLDFEIDGEDIRFDFGLADIPKGRHQRDRGNDYAEFVLVNKDNTNYQDFRPYEDIIERGYVTIYQVLQIEKDYYEGETKFVGYVQDFSIDESDKTMKFTALSDMSRKNFPVGARILTRERCGTEFNYNGLNSPLFHICGWQIDQGGNPVYCSKLLEGPDGCIAHGNAHRFFAVAALATASIEFVPSGEVDFPYGTGSCFTEKMFVVMADESLKPIGEVKAGDKNLGFEISTGKIIADEVLNTSAKDADKYVVARFDSNSRIEVIPSHLFNTRSRFFEPISSLVEKSVQGLDKDGKDAHTLLNKLYPVNKKTMIHNLYTRSSSFIVTDGKSGFKHKVHNQKMETPTGNI